MPRGLLKTHRVNSGPVMGLCPRTVKRDSGIFDTAILDPAGNFGSDQGAIGTECHLQTTTFCMTCQVPDIRPHQGLTAGEQDERDTHIRKVIDDTQRFCGREFPLS